MFIHSDDAQITISKSASFLHRSGKYTIAHENDEIVITYNPHTSETGAFSIRFGIEALGAFEKALKAVAPVRPVHRVTDR